MEGISPHSLIVQPKRSIKAAKNESRHQLRLPVSTGVETFQAIT
jgi:hypothetical protein